ncbi:MAG: thiol reductant ABC exporter subunit CydD [Gammaproteobacteria bacterium]|nr:thiol reductant ABC exporter subunit CydD [Gammaproteobacteria bacterium]
MEAAAWLRGQARTLRRPLARVAGVTALQALLLVGQAWWLADMLAAVVLRRAVFIDLRWQWIGALSIVPLRFALGVSARRTAYATALNLTSRLRRAHLDTARDLGPLGLRDVASGELLTGIVEGVDALLPYYARYLPQAGAAVIVPLLLAVVILPLDWISGLVLVLTAPLVPLFMILVGNAAARASARRLVQLRRLGAAMIDALGGLSTLRQLGAAERVAARLDVVGKVYRDTSMQVLRVAFLSSLVLEFLAMVSIAVVAVLIGFRLLWSELALREGLFVLLFAPEFYLPLRALGALRHARDDAHAAAANILALRQACAPATAPAVGGRRRPPAVAPTVACIGLHYAYPHRQDVLRGLDLQLAPRTVTALVGATGGGKSTVLALLQGFARPRLGSIRVDGVDLAELDLTAWRRRIAWLPQHTHVFDGTVADNLLAETSASDAESLARAACTSGFDTVVTRLPLGWRAPLGERGVGLSGGELQRLALTRLWLRMDARLLLLDEPTAHLDDDSAATVHAAIRAAAADKTVLLIAHRLQSARLADHVVVLQDGRAVEAGTPAQLLRAGGAYARLQAAEAMQ